MAGKQFKSMDIWELLAHRAEIDALIRKKRKELERAPKTRRTSRTSVRVVTSNRSEAEIPQQEGGKVPPDRTRRLNAPLLKPADASAKRYCAAIYARITIASGMSHSNSSARPPGLTMASAGFAGL